MWATARQFTSRANGSRAPDGDPARRATSPNASVNAADDDARRIGKPVVRQAIAGTGPVAFARERQMPAASCRSLRRAFEVVDRAKDAPFEALPSELGEEAFHGIEPGAGGRREVERPSRMLGEPGQHLRMFMGGIVIEDGVDHLADRDGPLDGCDEADELLMPMARHAAADDLAFEHAERGELGRRAVAFVIVREGCAFPPLQRKTRLGPVERLDLAFLVDGGLAIIAVVAEQQRGDMRPRAFRIRPADDSELAPVEPF